MTLFSVSLTEGTSLAKKTPLKPVRTLLSLIAFALLALVFAIFTPAAEAKTIGIGSVTLDSKKVRGQRWARMKFEPISSGSHVIRIASRSNADVRFSVFEVSNTSGSRKDLRIASTSNTSTPRKWQGKLDRSKNYALGVWAVSGSGKFTATIKAESTGAGREFVDYKAGIETAKSWQIRGTANATVTSGKTLFVGGKFTGVYNSNGGFLPRKHLAALNRYTGEPTNFSPSVDGEVWALALSPNKKILYVGGSFLSAEGLPRKRIAAYDAETGALTSFETPALNSAVRAIAVDKNKVYLGGLFTKVGNKRRSYVAAFDSATGELDPAFNASPNARVMSLAKVENRLWIGGNFTRINGTKQKGVGALDSRNGSLRASDDVAYPVIALAASSTQIFIAGGGPGGRAAAFNQATGREQWEISSDGNFQAVDVDKGRFVYFGGHYEIIEGNKSIDRLTRHDKRTGRTDVSWLPEVNGIRSINAIDVTPGSLYIGGDFTKIETKPHEGFAILPGQTK